MKKRILIALVALGSFICPALAQKAAVKTNFLYDATTTMNLGVEFGFPQNGHLTYPETTILGRFQRTRNGSTGSFSQRPDTGSVTK